MVALALAFLGRHWKLLACAILLSWGLRVDHLRAGYKETIATIKIAFKDMGNPVSDDDKIVPELNKVDAERKRFRRERDDAQSVVDVQSASINALEAETAEARRLSDVTRKQIAEVTRQRDAWIRRAREASTRTERLSAEEEARECEQVMDRLYAQGF